VVVAAKNVKGIPPYFATSYPDCGQHARQRNASRCLAAAPYSVHDIRRRAGLFELVAAPLGICSEAGLKSPGLRHLVNNVTRPLFERNILPASPRLPHPPAVAAVTVRPSLEQLPPARPRPRGVLSCARPAAQVFLGPPGPGGSCAGAGSMMRGLTAAPAPQPIATVSLHRDNLPHIQKCAQSQRDRQTDGPASSAAPRGPMGRADRGVREQGGAARAPRAAGRRQQVCKLHVRPAPAPPPPVLRAVDAYRCYPAPSPNAPRCCCGVPPGGAATLPPVLTGHVSSLLPY
jgi:hypothetical protein